jgi:molybdenum cofactor cytidylyltransferase
MKTYDSRQTFTALILAGGESQRMNQPKAFLPVNGITFIENITNNYIEAGIKNITVVMNHRFMHLVSDNLIRNVKVIPNFNPELGRYHSLRIGLKECGGDYVFIHNCDNPYIEKKVADSLREKARPDSYVVPTYHGYGGHPVLLSKKIASCIANDETSTATLRTALAKFRRTEAAVDSPLIRVNVNTRHDYDLHILSHVAAT